MCCSRCGSPPCSSPRGVSVAAVASASAISAASSPLAIAEPFAEPFAELSSSSESLRFSCTSASGRWRSGNHDPGLSCSQSSHSGASGPKVSSSPSSRTARMAAALLCSKQSLLQKYWSSTGIQTALHKMYEWSGFLHILQTWATSLASKGRSSGDSICSLHPPHVTMPRARAVGEGRGARSRRSSAKCEPMC